jgi:hypothetical protein
MEIPWIDDRCILCTEKHHLTEEHIIPDQIGGLLWSRILCKDCNDLLGHSIEAKIKHDPTIRFAIEAVKNEAPELFKKISNGLGYVAKSKRGTVKGKLKNDEFRPRAYKETDGSIIQATDDAKKNIKNILQKRQMNDQSIAHVLNIVDEAPLDELVKLDDSMEITKWSIDEIHPDMTGDMMDEAVPLKIAYEFLALHVGSAIYQEPLNSIRYAILNESKNPDVYEIEHLRSTNYEPLHGIFIEQNHPYIQIKIIFFRWIVYCVKLYSLALDNDLPRVVYEVDLKTGEEKIGTI